MEHDWGGWSDRQDRMFNTAGGHIPFEDKPCLIGTASPLLPTKSSGFLSTLFLAVSSRDKRKQLSQGERDIHTHVEAEC
jgi:hypothetical protein